MAGLSVLVIEAFLSWIESLQILENCLSSVNLVLKWTNVMQLSSRAKRHVLVRFKLLIYEARFFLH